MNAGFPSFIFLFITIILLWSGWRQIFLEGISQRMIALFLVGWFVLVMFAWEIDKLTVINFGVLVYLITAFCIFWTSESSIRLHLISLAFLMGTVIFLLQELFRLDPILIVINSYLDITVITLVITLISFREVKHQVFLISSGILFGEGLFLYFNQKRLPFYYGDWEMYDLWWMITFSTVVMGAVVRFVSQVWKEKRGLLANRKMKSR
jgi:hypothetical protein